MADISKNAKPEFVGGNPEEIVEYTAPMDYTGHDTKEIFVAVNGESIRIRRGDTVRIKRKFLMALENANVQDRAARDLQMKLSGKT